MAMLVCDMEELRRVLREELRAASPATPGHHEDRRVSPTEAAAAAGVSPATVRAWAAAGRIKRYGEGRRGVRYSLAEVLAVRPAERGFDASERALEILGKRRA